MKTIKGIMIFLVFLVPVTIFAQGYLGPASYSVLDIAKDVYELYNPDGSITPEARSRLLEELSKLYTISEKREIDTNDVKTIVFNDKRNLPIANVLDKQKFSYYAGLYIFKSTRGPFVTSFIDILGNLLLGKASQAARNTLFSLFLNDVFTSDEMKILFPNTAEFFKTFSVSKLKTSPKVFAETFKSDFKEVPFNIPKIFTTIPKYKDTLDANPHLKLFIESNRYYSELNKSKSIFEINHKTLSNLNSPDNSYSDLYNSLKLLQYTYFQFGGGTQSKNSYSQGFLESAKELKDNPVLQDIFLGLICAQNPKIEFAMGKTDNEKKSGGQRGEGIQIIEMTPLINILRKTDSQNQLVDYYYNYAEKYDELNQFRDTIDAYKYYGLEVPEESRESYFEKSVDFLEYSLNPGNIYSKGEFDKKEVNLFIEVIRKYKTLEKNINSNQSLAALFNTFYIYRELCRTHSAFGLIYQGFSGNFLRGLSITADLLSAQNNEDFARIANDYIFSGTDAQAKKESDVSLNLNSYIGYYYGKQADNVKNNWTRNNGFMAPIGLEFSKGFKDFGNLSLFVPVFDLGAVIDFKVNGDSTETDTQLEFDNIISPGLYLIYGIPKLPISIGGGFQFSPHLSKITTEGKIIEPRKLRWNVFIAFDLPLFKIF